MVERESVERRWLNFNIHGYANSEGTTLPKSRSENRTWACQRLPLATEPLKLTTQQSSTTLIDV